MSEMSYIFPMVLVALLLAIRIWRGIRGWKWQNEHPDEALRNWKLGG